MDIIENKYLELYLLILNIKIKIKYFVQKLVKIFLYHPKSVSDLIFGNSAVENPSFFAKLQEQTNVGLEIVGNCGRNSKETLFK